MSPDFYARLASCRRVVFSILWCVIVGGCSQPVANRADSGTSFDLAIESMEAGKPEEAVRLFTDAIDGGGLNADQIGRAFIGRAIVRARMGELAEANADLVIAEQGADLAQVYAARSYLLAKEGKPADAKRMLSQARRQNPDVEEIKD